MAEFELSRAGNIAAELTSAIWKLAEIDNVSDEELLLLGDMRHSLLGRANGLSKFCKAFERLEGSDMPDEQKSVMGQQMRREWLDLAKTGIEDLVLKKLKVRYDDLSGDAKKSLADISTKLEEMAKCVAGDDFGKATLVKVSRLHQEVLELTDFEGRAPGA